MFMEYDRRSPRDRAPVPGAEARREPGTQFVSADAPLAMVYAPRQRFDGIYDMEKGLKTGTIFSALDLPFLPDAGQGGRQ